MSGQTRLLRVGLGRFLVPLAALAGLFAMHGMSDHGTAGPGAVAGISATRAASALAPTDMPVTSAGHHQIGDELPSWPSHEHGIDVAGLCLAIIGAVLLIGSALVRRWHNTLPAWPLGFSRGLVTAACRRAAKPPDLLALSIQRC
jgi:hypothetical protein